MQTKLFICFIAASFSLIACRSSQQTKIGCSDDKNLVENIKIQDYMDSSTTFELHAPELTFEADSIVTSPAGSITLHRPRLNSKARTITQSATSEVANSAEITTSQSSQTRMQKSGTIDVKPINPLNSFTWIIILIAATIIITKLRKLF